ncbi:DUF2441 domain-containing protein [Bradyrhizobium sp. DASA03076]|uniref:DUF2441 domain-containing protein n=1 Tax=Bradyrhizobium sp. BLXBL-03 TaxID=3395916 RepID=UPI003F6EA69F
MDERLTAVLLVGPMMDQNEFYHLATVRLRAGSIIEAGNWGRLLRRYQNASNFGNIFGNSWILAREAFFEIVRLEQFPNKPSRWQAAFCCMTAEDARGYQQKTDRPAANVLHRVELVDPEANFHVGPLNSLDWPPPDTSFVDVTRYYAMAYWGGQCDGPQEFITLSPLRILESYP